jgi:hypothetical protein
LIGSVGARPKTANAIVSGIGLNAAKGFDACGIPSNTASLQPWWTSSPYYWIGTYLPAPNRPIGGSCYLPDAAWYDAVNNMGWRVAPIYVGLQAPCVYQGGLARMSYSLPQAAADGQSAGWDAVSRAQGRGLWSTVLFYDMEAFNTNDVPCIQAVQTFINEFNNIVEANGYKTGYYGSTCASAAANVAQIPTWPRMFWGAQWDGNPSTGAMNCVSPGDWWNRERYKQYVGGHPENYGGVVISMDNDCANSWVSPAKFDPGDASCY